MKEPSTSVTHERHAWGRQFFAQLQRYRDLLRRRWWVPAVCICLALGVGVALNKFMPPLYISVGQMIVPPKLTSVPQSSQYSEETGNFLGTQAALMSGTQVQKAARDRVVSAATNHPPLVPTPVTLQVSVLPRTTIFMLRAYGEDPVYAKKFLQACMDEYINLKKSMAKDTSLSTITGLKEQMLLLEPKMDKIDEQRKAFLATNEVALLQETASVGTYLTLLYQQLAEAESELELLRAMTLDQNLLLEQDRLPAMAAAPGATAGTGNNLLANPSSAQSGLGSATSVGSGYLSVKQQILLLKAEQDRYAQYLKPEHPKMQEMDRAIDRLGRMLKIYSDQSQEQLEAKKSALSLQITNLTSQLKTWGKQSIELSRKSDEYGRIKAKGDRVQLLYDQLQATLETLDVGTGIGQEPVTVYQPASDAYPDPSLPLKRLVISGVVGLGLSIGILMLLARVDDRISTFIELQDLFEEELLGQIPLEKGQMKGGSLPLLEMDDTRHPFVEAYRNLRSSLLYTAETGSRPHTLLVTSSVPNDGKSLTAANLAIMLAMGGARVLLVDADLRKGNLHNRFGLKVETGLSEALAQGTDWRAAIKQTSTERLFLLPRGATTQRSSELFLSDVMKNFLVESIKGYDYVLLDTAPVMAADDVTSLAPRVDGVIFVVRAQYTSARVARASLDMLYQRKARVLGLVFNSVRTSSGDYYYYHRYKDYYGYGNTTPKK